MKTKLIIIYLILNCSQLFAQHARFITEGTIEYTKRVNIYAAIKQQMGGNPSDFSLQAYDLYKRDYPQFLQFGATLTFSKGKTLYTPAIPDGTVSNDGNPLGTPGNIIYTDLPAASSIMQKEFLGQLLLIKDSTRKINWKITDETRDIAGYPCRRANALIMDSIYVVAFYTERIRVNGGPESFTGLPGMILELAIPHENVTWLATKVTDAQVPESTLVPPKKGKQMERAQFYKLIKDTYKSSNYKYFLKILML
jgi:GLPGLI family protein